MEKITSNGVNFPLVCRGRREGWGSGEGRKIDGVVALCEITSIYLIFFFLIFSFF